MTAMNRSSPPVLGRRKARRAGFSLIELLMAMSIVGILAGLALPNLRSMTFRARATEVAADVDAVSVATVQYNADSQFTWPAEVGQGTIPAGLAPYLPDGFSFQGNGYVMDYDYLSPVVVPGDPSTDQLIAVSVVVDTDELSNAVLELLSGTIVFSVGRRHTILIARG
jgi:prepilin-type N-terminal cleavage/methylation domain-containing protein